MKNSWNSRKETLYESDALVFDKSRFRYLFNSCFFLILLVKAKWMRVNGKVVSYQSVFIIFFFFSYARALFKIRYSYSRYYNPEKIIKPWILKLSCARLYCRFQMILLLFHLIKWNRKRWEVLIKHWLIWGFNFQFIISFWRINYFYIRILANNRVVYAYRATISTIHSLDSERVESKMYSDERWWIVKNFLDWYRLKCRLFVFEDLTLDMMSAFKYLVSVYLYNLIILLQC